MLRRRASLVALLRCSVLLADSRSSSSGYVLPVLAASCICCICCFASCLLSYTAPLRLPGCCPVVLFPPRLPVSLLRCVFSIASRRCVCSVFTPFSYLALCALASNVRSCPPSFAPSSRSYSLNLRAINALMCLGAFSRKMRRKTKYCLFKGG